MLTNKICKYYVSNFSKKYDNKLEKHLIIYGGKNIVEMENIANNESGISEILNVLNDTKKVSNIIIKNQEKK